MSGLTSDYHHVHDDVQHFTHDKNRLRERWQRTRDPADNALFNTPVGKLRRDMKAFRRRYWELVVARMGSIAEGHEI